MGSSGVKPGGRERMEGGDCCGCGLATINIQTGVEPQDILFVSMDNQVGIYTHASPASLSLYLEQSPSLLCTYTEIATFCKLICR